MSTKSPLAIPTVGQPAVTANSQMAEVSATYTQALKVFGEADRAYRVTAALYHDMKIGDKVFGAAIKVYNAAQAVFDLAFATEQARGE